MIDLKGHGYASGKRMMGWTPFDLHEQVGVILSQARNDKPLFLFGHSMGALVTTTFLLKNPSLKISGVILSAPFFGFHDSLGLYNPIKLASVAAVSKLADVSNFLYHNQTHVFFYPIGIGHSTTFQPFSSNP
jgi:alpha-beta hydrolase superfamily lysophospholipase